MTFKLYGNKTQVHVDLTGKFRMFAIAINKSLFWFVFTCKLSKFKVNQNHFFFIF